MPRTLEAVVAPAGYVEITCAILIGEVAGKIPAVSNYRLGSFTVFVVTEKQSRIRGRNRELAELADGHRLQLVIENRHADARQWFTDRSGFHRISDAIADDELVFRYAVVFV